MALLANCVLATTLADSQTVACKTCAADFWVVDGEGSCVAKTTVAQCAGYRKVNGAVVCVRCQDRYGLVGGQCVQGQDPSCVQYKEGSTTACVRCDAAAVTMIWGDTVTCQKISASRNCLTMQYDQNSKVFGCASCARNQFVAQSLEQPPVESLCIAYPFDYCLAVSANSSGQLMCIFCSDNYYLDNFMCRPRTLVPNCAQYEAARDACQRCSRNFYLKPDNSCGAVTPVPGCKEYE